MIKLSGEATIGLCFEVLVGILDHLHVREPLIIWGLFVVGLFLIGDSIIRGEWADKIADKTKRTGRRTLYGVVACILFLGFGYWIFGRLQTGEPTSMQSQQPTTTPKQMEDSTKARPVTQPKPPRASSTKNKPVPMRQDCAPGASCGMSSGQQGGITAGTINFGPPQRTIDRDNLVACLSADPGKISFGALATDPASETYKFTVILREAFRSAHWTITKEQIIPMFNSAAPEISVIFNPNPTPFRNPPNVNKMAACLGLYAHINLPLAADSRKDWDDSITLVVGPGPN